MTLESDSLWREKKLLQELEGCPFMVRCPGKDVTTEKGQTLYNLLLEYASGGSLADCIHSCGLPEKIRWKSEEDECGLRGTPAYAAPEPVHKHKYLPESDVWALGCSIVHMLTGRQPWLPEKEKDVMFEVDFRDVILEIPNNIKISRVAKDFLNKCLIKDPTARWKADMLLNHPFLQNVDDHTPKGRHRLSHRIYSLVPQCFQVEARG
ncbi:mitogen-activated protein kinase kinase kinase 21 [Striga hermonthica]|uniref:Mitogen-activated protein kinase kinase kinase 21 n=1 Tax=Striga hermonthica TaxID=68872 RepID=A0A9N7NJB8_STRHE|nr:mitogen-activated protein kinase kinase kinase 21 [Striga hermonthica]